MDYKEAIETIKSNYPPDNYTMLREALNMAISSLEKVKRYEMALRFYADPKNYELSTEADKADLTEFINVLDMDSGDVAKKALKI